MNTIATLEKDLQRHKETEYSIRSLIKLHLPDINIDDNDPVQLLGLILTRIGEKSSSEKILTYNYNITKNSTSHSTSSGNSNNQPSVSKRNGNFRLKQELDESATITINEAVNNIKDAQNLRQTSNALDRLLEAFKDILNQNYDGIKATQTKDNIEEIQNKLNDLTSTPPPKQGVESSTIFTLKQIKLPQDETENITNVDTEKIYTTIINIVQYAYDNSENLEYVKEYIRQLQMYTKALQRKLAACYGVIQIIGKCLKENKIVFTVTILPDGNYICSIIKMIANFILKTENILQLNKSNIINMETIETLENAIKLYKNNFNTTCRTLLNYLNKYDRKDDDDYNSALQLEQGQNDEPTNILDTRDLENISTTIVRVIQKLTSKVDTTKALVNQYIQKENRLNREIENLKESLERFNQSDYKGVIATLESSEMRLKNDYKTLEATMNKYKSINDELMKTNGELQIKIKLNGDVQENYKKLEEVYGKLKEDNRTLQKENDTLLLEKEEECQSIKDKLKKTEKEIEILNKRLDEKRITIEQMEKDNQENINVNDKNVSTLKKLLLEKDYDINNLKTQIKNLEKQKSESIKSASDFNRLLSENTEKLDKQKAEMTSTIKEQAETINNLNTEIKTLTLNLLSSRQYNDQVTAKQRKSMAIITDLGIENDTLKSKIKELQTVVELRDITVNERILQADKEYRQSVINQNEIKNLIEQKDTLKKENETLKKENDVLKKTIESETRVQKLSEQTLSSQFEQTQSDLKTLEDQLKEEKINKEIKNKEFQEFILKENQYLNKIKLLEETIAKQLQKPTIERGEKPKIKKTISKMIKSKDKANRPLPTGPIRALITPNIQKSVVTESLSTIPTTSQTTTISKTIPKVTSLESDIKAKTITLAESRPSTATAKRKLDTAIETIAKKITTEPMSTKETMAQRDIENKVSVQEMPTLISTTKPL